MNNIPVIIHESDMTPGLANKISIPFATKVCVTFPESMAHIGKEKALLTGLPIREGILQGKASKGVQLCDFHTLKPVILVMGGSLGSQVLNGALRANLDRLLEQFQIVHLVGKGNVDAELAGKRGYRQFEYLNEELPDVLAMSSLVISRAGATSLFEFLGLKKPMLLIPLSLQASRGDQILNAASFEKAGYADVLPEEQLTAETLTARVEALYANRERYIAAMSARQDTDAVSAIVSLIEASSLKA